MRIRTLTYFLSGFPDDRELLKAGRFLADARLQAQEAGFEVQTVRLALGSLEAVLFDPRAGSLGSLCSMLEEARLSQKVDFLSLGIVRDSALLSLVGAELIRHPRLCVSAEGAAWNSGVNQAVLKASADLTLRLSRETPQGLGNFSFCASFCVGGGTPFFPSGYSHPGPSSFALGLENSDLLVKAMGGVGGPTEGLQRFREAYQAACGPLETLFTQLERQTGVPCLGLDTSLAPSLDPGESLALAFERAGLPLGSAGSLGLCSEVTQILRELKVRKTGYRGLMLPVLEDAGLCTLADQDRLSISTLLMHSSVCGVGLDTVPVPGNIPESSLLKLYADVAGLALKWNKPLSARLFPVAGKKAGERTTFESPHLTNCRILGIS
ncbi:MAG: DUF711 family protein [Planctomycetota bacterium]